MQLNSGVNVLSVCVLLSSHDFQLLSSAPIVLYVHTAVVVCADYGPVVTAASSNYHSVVELYIQYALAPCLLTERGDMLTLLRHGTLRLNSIGLMDPHCVAYKTAQTSGTFTLTSIACARNAGIPRVGRTGHIAYSSAGAKASVTR